MNRLERIAAGVCVAAAVLLCALIVQRTILNPMASRRSELDLRLTEIAVEDREYETGRDVDYAQLYDALSDKPEMWNQLIKPPPVRKRIAPPPNLQKMLKGVIASARREIGQGDQIKIQITTPQDKRGSWYGVGDTLNGLTIKEIKPGGVVFALQRGVKEHTFTLPRL